MAPKITDIIIPNNGSETKIVEVTRKNSYHPKLLQMPPSKSIDISFENITYSVRKSPFSRERKQVLKGVSGLFKCGELTAIMGPSGAGKSSLLNVLSGFIKKGVGGSVYANGTRVDSERSQTKHHSAYILQDDHLNPLFTVKETMQQAADLKLGPSSTKKSKNFLIESILDSMSMSETSNTLCKRLSGGQKKRLNVCLELIDNPPIIFLDEPTSGLDSSSSCLLVNELKGMAEAGRTVICTIHQPSAGLFSMFDHLYFVSDGHCVYQGDTANVLSFLEYVGLPCPIFHNPADFFMDVVTGEFGNYTNKFLEANKSKNWRQDEESKLEKDRNRNILEKADSSNSSIEVTTSSEWHRFKCLVPKLYKQLHRDWTVTYLKLILHVALGILFGLLFAECGYRGEKVISNVGFLFTSMTLLSFTSLMPAALKFPDQIQVLKKEHFNNWYKFKTYYLAFLCVHIPIQVLFTFAFMTISYVMTGQPLEIERYLLSFAACTIISILAELFGLVMGTFGPVNGVFNGSIFIVVMALHGGFIALLRDFPYPMYLYSFLSFFRYCFEVYVTALYGFGRGKLECPNTEMYCHLRYSEMLFNELGLDERNLIRNFIILAVYIVVVAILTFFKLRHSLKNFH